LDEAYISPSPDWHPTRVELWLEYVEYMSQYVDITKVNVQRRNHHSAR
jgi:hypothetical protein